MQSIGKILSFLTDYYQIHETLKPQECLPFISTDPQKANQLLIHQTEEEILVELQFSGEVLQSLNSWEQENKPPLSQETAVAIEELSHLVYTLFNGRKGNPVSQLELEVQGEIDRFLFLQEFLNPHRLPTLTEQLFQMQFGSLNLHEHVANNLELRSRYQEAYRLGRQCCQVISIEGRHSPDRARSIAQKIFYQSGHSKLHTLETLKASA